MKALSNKLAEYLNILNSTRPLENIYYYNIDEKRLPIEIEFQNTINSYKNVWN